MALPNLSALSLGPSSRRRSLRGLAEDAEDTEGKRSNPGDDVEKDAMDVSGAGTEAANEAREAPPAKEARVSDMRFCMLLHGQTRAVDEEGKFGDSLPTRSQLVANIPEFQAFCSNAQAGRETAAVVRGDDAGGTAGVVYDSLTFAVLAVATVQNKYIDEPSNWVEKMASIYRRMHQHSAMPRLQEFAHNLFSGDVNKWVELFDYLSSKGLAFYVDFVCSAASTARVQGRIGAGSLVMQGVSNWISYRFIKPAAMVLSVDPGEAHGETGYDRYRRALARTLVHVAKMTFLKGDEAAEAADRYNIALGRVRALTWFYLQSLPTAEGFWGKRMDFVKYANNPPMYFRWVTAYAQEPGEPRRLMPLPEISLGWIQPPYDGSVDMMDESLALLVRALHAVLLLWYPFLRPTMPSTPTKVTTVRQFLEWYDKYTQLRREFGPGLNGEIDVKYAVRNGGEELTQLQQDFINLLTTTLVNVPRPVGRAAELFFGERGSLAHNNFHHFKHHLLTQAGKEGRASIVVLNKVPARQWEMLRADPPSTYVGDFVRSVTKLVDAAPDSMKVNVVPKVAPKVATSYEDVDVQLVEHVKALYAVFFLWYPQVRPKKVVRYKQEHIATLKEFVELYNRYVHANPQSESLVQFDPMERAGYGAGYTQSVHTDLITLAYSSLRNVRRLGASADALGTTGTLNEDFLAYAKGKMREATLFNKGAGPKALDRVAKSYWKELREAGRLQEAAEPPGTPSGSNEHFVRAALKRITNPLDISDGSLDPVLAEVHKVAQALHGLCYKLRPTSPFLVEYISSDEHESMLEVPLTEFLSQFAYGWRPYRLDVSTPLPTSSLWCWHLVHNAVIDALQYIDMSGEALEKLGNKQVRPGYRKRASSEAITFMLCHIANIEMPDKALSDNELIYGTKPYWTQLYESPPPGRIGDIFTAFRQAEHLEAYHNISVAKRSLEKSHNALKNRKLALESYTRAGGAEEPLARIQREIAELESVILTEAAALDEWQAKRAALPVEPISQLRFERRDNMPDE